MYYHRITREEISVWYVIIGCNYYLPRHILAPVLAHNSLMYTPSSSSVRVGGQVLPYDDGLGGSQRTAVSSMQN